MSNWWLLLILCVCSYLFGNINNAVIISKIKKSDIRTMGSGNPGTLNMGRNFGLKVGLFVFFLDIIKGAIPSLIAFLLFRGQYFEGTDFIIGDLAKYLCGFCVIIGHIYPVFMHFKGGKGIASTIGVFIVAECVCGWSGIVVVALSVAAATIFILITKFGAMGSFIGITPPAVSGSIRLFLAYNGSTEALGVLIVTDVLIFLICFFTWFAHKTNIAKMLSGEEHATSLQAMAVKSKEIKKSKNTQRR